MNTHTVLYVGEKKNTGVLQQYLVMEIEADFIACKH